MIEILFLFLTGTGITDTDGLLQISGEKSFNRLCIPQRECSAEGIKLRRVFAGFFLKPFINLFRKDFAYLKVRDYQLKGSAISAAALGQVSCSKQDAPEVIHILIDVPVGKFLADFLSDRAAVYQAFQLPS